MDKGLYSANLAYWDDLRQIRDAFFKSDRSLNYTTTIINSAQMVDLEQLNTVFFATSYDTLLTKQNDSITV